MRHFDARAAMRVLFLVEHLNEAYSLTRAGRGFCPRCAYPVDEEYVDSTDLRHGRNCAVPAAEIELTEKFGLDIAEASTAAARAQLLADARREEP